jgi:hypothetical protein
MAILSTLLYYRIRREELAKLEVKDYNHTRSGRRTCGGRSGKTCFVPAYPGTLTLIKEYPDAAGHGQSQEALLFRPIKKTYMATCVRAHTDSVYFEGVLKHLNKVVFRQGGISGENIHPASCEATAATNAWITGRIPGTRTRYLVFRFSR